MWSIALRNEAIFRLFGSHEQSNKSRTGPKRPRSAEALVVPDGPLPAMERGAAGVATIPGNDRTTMSRQFPPEQATSEREFCLKHKRPPKSRSTVIAGCHKCHEGYLRWLEYRP